MSDQPTKKIIDQALSAIKNSEKGYPSQITLCSLIQDNEDILFISHCSISWDWMIGRTKIHYSNKNSIVILTRQRLIFAGGKELPFEIAHPLSEIKNIFKSTVSIQVVCDRNFANDPPNPPNEQSGYRPFPKDPRKEISYTLDIWGEQNKLFSALNTLPYPIGSLSLHQDILTWNQLSITFEALQIISRWMAADEPFPDVARINKLLRAGESICYLTKLSIDYGYQTKLTEEKKRNTNHWNILGRMNSQKHSHVDNLTPSIVLLTDQRMFLISEHNLEDIISWELDDVTRIVDVKENSNYEELYGRAKNPKIEMYFGQQAFLLRPLSGEDTLNFLEEIQSIGYKSKIVTHRVIPIIKDRPHILKPFELFSTANRIEDSATAAETKSSKSGYVYILINFQLPANTLKIGKTIRSPEERAQEIFTTGVPGEYIVAYEEHVLDSEAAEAVIHSRLATYRINNQREFFRLPLKHAVKVMHEVALEIGIID